ncbi:MAG: FHA domain-containing protein [Gammaproteobacteria bacterium]|nr:FHA domain-containing protein [Gammaproteobacteria bacterium]
MSKIVHTRNGQPYKEYELKPGTLSVGRRPDCDIQLLDDITVSGEHAKIFIAASTYMDGLFDVIIEDQRSTNGTTLKGNPIKRHRWKHGDLIKIGLHEFTLIDEETRAFEETNIVLPEDDE